MSVDEEFVTLFPDSHVTETGNTASSLTSCLSWEHFFPDFQLGDWVVKTASRLHDLLELATQLPKSQATSEIFSFISFNLWPHSLPLSA